MESLTQTQAVLVLAITAGLLATLTAIGLGIVEHMPLAEVFLRWWWRLTKRQERMVRAARARPVTSTRRAA